MARTLARQNRHPVLSNFLKPPGIAMSSSRLLAHLPVFADRDGRPPRRHVLRNLLRLVEREHHAAEDRVGEARRAADLPRGLSVRLEVAQPVRGALRPADLVGELPLVPAPAGQDRAAVLLDDLLQALLGPVPVLRGQTALDEEHPLVAARPLGRRLHPLHDSVLPAAPPSGPSGPRLKRAMVLSVPDSAHDSTASAARSNDSSATGRSAFANRPSTKSFGSPRVTGPTPMRSRGYACVPSAASTSSRPLWPPDEPEARIRSVPSGIAKSSHTTSIAPASITPAVPEPAVARSSARRATAPDRFIQERGWTRSVSFPARRTRAASALSVRSLRRAPPWRAARRSTTSKPALCRVPRYSSPGLPSPTTTSTPSSSLRP